MQDVSSMAVLHAKTIKEKNDPFENRIALIDFLRGLLIILVIFDHLMYDLWDFLPKFLDLLNITSGPFYKWVQDFFLSRDPNLCYFEMPVRIIIREAALSLFVLLSGISSAFSKDNNKRAVKMIMFAILLSLVTNLFQCYLRHWEIDKNAVTAINFNIIALIGVCVLTYCFFENKSANFLLGFTLCLLFFFAILYPIIQEDMYNEPFLFFPLFKPHSLLVNGHNYYMVDYMPLFPYIIWFFIGATISKVVYANPSQHLKHNYNWMRPTCFVGRHSLVIYVTHQIVLYVILIIILQITKAVI